MAPPPRAALALLLLAALGPAAPAPQWPPRNGSEAEGRGWGGSPERDPASGAPPGTPSNGTSPGGAPSAGDTPLGPQLEPPGGGTASTTDPAGRLAGCPGCAGEGDASALPPTPGSAEGSEAATGVTWPGDGGAVAVAIGSPEEAGSGEQPTRASLHGAGFLGGLTAAPPSLPGLPSPGLPSPGLPSPGLGTDSAESDLLLAAGGSAAVRPPVPGDSGRELWLASSSPAPAQGARGRTDRTWLDVQEPVTATPGTAEPPAPEIIDVDYYDLFEGGEGLGGGRGAAGSARREPGGGATPWALHELYDDFTPFDESDFYPTTSFYAEGDEEEEEEDELEEEDEEDEEEDGGLEDENGYRPPASAVPRVPPAPRGPRPSARPPKPPGAAGGSPPAPPRPGERLVPENGTECRSGFVRHNGSCRSVCDLVPSYCHNGGQCYLVEGLGAFCRCNTQDYTWHKGTRCESIVTDFQVLCVAVGSAALVLLLLFMLTVCFAKKLYLLKTENSKLRKTKYRTPSELHNDNFSLSTIAEGSHPNDDPNAPHKLQDSLKSCLKDEEPPSIHSTAPAPQEGGKGEPGGCGVPCLHNNLA
ncbi:chondroitin sulfate proteoglycan 5 isoform X1 [Anser cygnoides]|uniref:chondroitin sulfate proteoglycan 5 isoform X1 n=1 Tax=Anser cygnoides TaxID=8845 RepID=UPI0034D2444C